MTAVREFYQPAQTVVASRVMIEIPQPRQLAAISDVSNYYNNNNVTENVYLRSVYTREDENHLIRGFMICILSKYIIVIKSSRVRWTVSVACVEDIISLKHFCGSI